MRFLTALAITLATGTLTACGDDQPTVMPDVASRRLDIALSDIERAGFEDEVEVLGGGTFGVVDESNWMVCDQEPSAGTEISSAPRLTVDRECESEDALEGDETSEQEAEGSEEPQKTTSRPVKPSKGKTAGGSDAFVMPNLVGMNLQDAQDTLQSEGSFLLTQTDATGMERFQVLDSNWKVCSQVPAPGVKVPLERMVDLRAVQLDESCP
jgi:beta-lactam-binding protein with PASTA domain